MAESIVKLETRFPRASDVGEQHRRSALLGAVEPEAVSPPAEAVRSRIRELARERARHGRLVPPLTLDELSEQATVLLTSAGIASAYRDFTMVMLGNALWEDRLAEVPQERRLLLLPQCLRDRRSCPAEMDELGLLCEQCGGCAIGEIQAEAESLGCTVLVAEGTTVATRLVASGQIEAVVGVGCLHSLERSFPHTVAAAGPAMAIPLINDGCDRTRVDLGWVREALTLRRQARAAHRVDLDQLRHQVQAWFDPASLAGLIEIQGTESERVAAGWLAAGGKRWRPLLVAAVAEALQGCSALRGADSTGGRHDRAVQALAVAAECFHKASLAHDDIEDGDEARYGEPALHVVEGLPVALNTGDLLIGEGYRLIAECGLGEVERACLLSVAAAGHRQLCLGQGAELCWSRRPRALGVDEVLQIFRSKTAPAFRVALGFGAVAGGADEQICRVLDQMSDSLGIAYQIRDDLADLDDEQGGPAAERCGRVGDLAAQRPSLLLALAFEHAAPALAERLEKALQHGSGDQVGEVGQLARGIIDRLGLEAEARRTLEHYRRKALRSLAPLTSSRLKSLLFRIVHRALDGSATDRPAALAAKSSTSHRGKGRGLGHAG